ncbi:hypothetical protein JK358_08570 [Nocardia sp. 2]|uniref:Uncharacterized protein n=1 Tax=Nocardia acididurans TaxID=2802282 RepID=A0ABS1M2P3_9NOCA|nr:hypothetical protein [Nocardia acididurans]MBL1074449.1 hypothetical protein [Nocardia acididurans]
MTRMGLGRRGAWAALTAGIAVLGLLEAAVLHFLAGAFLPDGVAVAVDVVPAVLTLLVVLAFASPLRGSVRVDAECVRVRFGWLAAANIPLPSIADIRPHVTDPRNPVELGLDFDEASGLLSLIRSPSSPLVRIGLESAVPARTMGLRSIAARAVLVSVGDADMLCDRIRNR